MSNGFNTPPHLQFDGFISGDSIPVIVAPN